MGRAQNTPSTATVTSRFSDVLGNRAIDFRQRKLADRARAADRAPEGWFSDQELYKRGVSEWAVNLLHTVTGELPPEQASSWRNQVDEAINEWDGGGSLDHLPRTTAAQRLREELLSNPKIWPSSVRTPVKRAIRQAVEALETNNNNRPEAWAKTLEAIKEASDQVSEWSQIKWRPRAAEKVRRAQPALEAAEAALDYQGMSDSRQNEVGQKKVMAFIMVAKDPDADLDAPGLRPWAAQDTMEKQKVTEAWEREAQRVLRELRRAFHQPVNTDQPDQAGHHQFR